MMVIMMVVVVKSLNSLICNLTEQVYGAGVVKVVQGLKIGTWTQEQLFRSKHSCGNLSKKLHQVHLNIPRYISICSGFISIFVSGTSQSSEPMLAPLTEESAVEESGFSILPSPP